MRARWLAFVVSLVGVGGCQGVLGDFTIGEAEDGGSDATTGASSSSGGSVSSASGGSSSGSSSGSSTGSSSGSSSGSSTGSSGGSSSGSSASGSSGSSSGSSASGSSGSSSGSSASSSSGSSSGSSSSSSSSSSGGSTCSASNCSTGCCDGNACVTATSYSQCQTDGHACQPCANSSFICSGGACECPSTEADCGGTCVNPQTDNTYCGASLASCSGGQTCAGGQTCQSGVCTCPTGDAFCIPAGTTTATCIDPQTNNAFCGASGPSCSGGQACSGGETCQSGACACPSGQILCGTATPTCTPDQTDANNCGACGHSCHGGTCAAGLCQPTLIGSTVYGYGYGIAVDATNVYVTEDPPSGGYVESCPLSGCTTLRASLDGGGGATATTLFSAAGNPGIERVRVDTAPTPSSYIYFGENNAGTTYAINSSGTVEFTVASDSWVTTTDATYLYMGGASGISKTNKLTGGTPTLVNTTTLTYVRGVSWNSSSNNVWGASPDINDVEWCGLTSGPCTVWSWGSDAPFDVHVVGGQPFVMIQSSGLFRCSSEADCSLANATQESTWGQESFADDGANVYFADLGSYVYDCPVGGCSSVGGPVKLAPSNGSVQDLTTDGTYLYWVTAAGGIYKVAK